MPVAKENTAYGLFVPPWGMFRSTMVEQNYLHGGTKVSPWWNEYFIAVYLLKHPGEKT